MAVIRSMQPLEELVSARDDLFKSYQSVCKTPITQYSMQDRQVIYEQRRFLRKEVDALNRKIGLADPEVSANGTTLADFLDLFWHDNLG